MIIILAISKTITYFSNSWMGQALSLISIIVTLFVTSYQAIKAIHSRKNYSWAKVKKGIKCLKAYVLDINPDIIVSLSGRGGIVANLLSNEVNNEFPVYTCILKGKLQQNFFQPDGWMKVSTSKWQIFIPPDILQMNNKRILIVDDITNSGETILVIKNTLVANKLNGDDIFSMALVADKETQKNKHIPDYYWKMVDIDKYNVPWGKTIINNYK